MSAKRSETVGKLINQALTWLQQQENQMWVEAASVGFFSTGAEMPQWAQQWLATLFPSWLLFDFRGPDGKTGLERFEEQFKSEIPKPDRKLLQRVKHERFRLVEVTEVIAGKGLKLRDLTTDEEFEVRDEQAADQLQAGTPGFVRVRRLGNINEIDSLAVLPPTLRDPLRLRIAALVDELRGDSDLNEEELFRTHAPLLFSLAIKLKMEFTPPTDVQSLPKAERKILEQAVADHFNRWIETPVDTLGGKTPREAAADPELRAELLTLLEELQQRAAADPTFPLDVSVLRGKLGIEAGE